MPYIDQDRRTYFDNDGIYIKTVGELNYRITMLIKQYQEQHKLSYQTINDIVGALDAAKQEYYRRVAVPYEESKIRTNGDVY